MKIIQELVRTEREKQGVRRALLADGICTEMEMKQFECGDIELGVMQVAALCQRLGRSVDKYDILLDDEEFDLALSRSRIWQGTRSVTDGEKTEKEIRAYEERLQRMEAGDCNSIFSPGEIMLQRQFLDISRAELARKAGLPYEEQRQIIRRGLLRTIPEKEWFQSGDVLEPQLSWLSERRLHLMEQILLARYVRVCERMGDKEKNIFTWYQKIAEYVNAPGRDRADAYKLHALMLYRMCAYELREVLGEESWKELLTCELPGETDMSVLLTGKENTVKDVLKGLLKEEEMKKAGKKREKPGDSRRGRKSWSVAKNLPSIQKIYDVYHEQGGRRLYQISSRCIMILDRLTEITEECIHTHRQYLVFRTAERLRILLMRLFPMFGENRREENSFCVMEEAWKEVSEENLTAEDYEPDYAEQGMRRLSQLLGQRMQMHDWDIYDFGDDIYSSAKKSVPPILSGKTKPKVKKRAAMLNKLGMSRAKYDAGLIPGNYSDFAKYARMMLADNARDTATARRLFLEICETLDWDYVTNEQWADYWEAMLDYRDGIISESEKQAEMWKVFEKSGIAKEKYSTIGCELSNMEWRALMELAWNHIENDLELVYRILKMQYDFLNETGRSVFCKNEYLQVIYCLSAITRELGKFELSEKYADEGIEKTIQWDRYCRWSSYIFAKYSVREERNGLRNIELKNRKYIQQIYAIDFLFRSG